MALSLNAQFQVKCGTRGDTGPACNAVGMIDRKIFGIQHLYKRPIYARSEVNIWGHYCLLPIGCAYPDTSFFFFFFFSVCSQQCSINSPDYGPLPPNAPSWCQAPFDPEGILRYPSLFWFYLYAINWRQCTKFTAVSVCCSYCISLNFVAQWWLSWPAWLACITGISLYISKWVRHCIVHCTFAYTRVCMSKFFFVCPM